MNSSGRSDCEKLSRIGDVPIRGEAGKRVSAFCFDISALMVNLLRLLVVLVVTASCVEAQDSFVRITLKPKGVVFDELKVPVSVSPNVAEIHLYVNGIPHEVRSGRSVLFTVPIGKYVRRLRIRTVGLDAGGRFVDDDEMMINDPQPPFRVRLRAPPDLPDRGMVRMTANVNHPGEMRIEAVEFFLGEELIGVDEQAPWGVEFDAAAFAGVSYARAVVRATNGEEEHDLHFFGSGRSEHVEVTLHEIPISVRGEGAPVLTREDIELRVNGERHPVEGVMRAIEQPLYVIMLIDSSQSMTQELPLVQEAAKEFARSLQAQQNAWIAVVAFGQRVIWLTGFTRDSAAIDAAVDRIDPRGQTHLYDAVITSLFELQKKEGRRALVVLSDGVNSGGDFELDHVVHYSRYSGVPVYPIIRNTLLSRLMRVGLRWFEANRFARIAEDSGASYFIVQRPEDLPGVYEQISEELGQQYLLLFYTEASNPDHWHTLRIEAKKRGVTIRAPRGFFP
jgi:VWFA-related protein